MHVVLVNPLIPQNTGSVARLCAGTDTDLHLVGQLGFSLEDRLLKRAGLDYWPGVRLHLHPDDYYPLGLEAGSVKERWFCSVLHTFGADSAHPERLAPAPPPASPPEPTPLSRYAGIAPDNRTGGAHDHH